MFLDTVRVKGGLPTRKFALDGNFIQQLLFLALWGLRGNYEGPKQEKAL